MMDINKVFWIRTDVGAIIHYALIRPVTCNEGVMNYGPYNRCIPANLLNRTIIVPSEGFFPVKESISYYALAS